MDNVVFPEDVKLTIIDDYEATYWYSKVDVKKILTQSIKNELEPEP